jgi:hypothetical protein
MFNIKKEYKKSRDFNIEGSFLGCVFNRNTKDCKDNDIVISWIILEWTLKEKYIIEV